MYRSQATRMLQRWGPGRAALLCGLTLAATAWAAPPLVPLDAPLCSFARESPAVEMGRVRAADLARPLADEFLEVVIPQEALGLFSPLDDLDGFGVNHPIADPNQAFLLLLSVDRNTHGAVGAEPNFIAAGNPYNVRDQAQKGQVGADQFASLHTFKRAGACSLRAGSNNTSLVRNNYNEGGTDFAAQPPSHARDSATGLPADEVDAAADDFPATLRDRGNTGVYFSLRSDSPSLMLLPGNMSPSGAHIFHNLQPGDTPTDLYASHAQLGLVQTDDIDAFIVFDVNTNGLYDGPDQVLFSLRPGSPSLTLIPGASLYGAGADLFVARPGTFTSLWEPAERFGLGLEAGPSDNIDALDLLIFHAPGPCPDPSQRVKGHSIRFVRGDWDDNGNIGQSDLPHWSICLTGPEIMTVQNSCQWYELDNDHDLDLIDFALFQQAFAGGL